MESLRSPLGRVRGLGSAKDGTHHWWAQRVTAVALIPLVLWLVVSVLRLVGAPHIEVAQWIGHPLNAALLAALIVAVFHHAQLGLQVVIEDYIHAEIPKLLLLMLNTFFAILMGGLCLFAILKIAFVG